MIKVGTYGIADVRLGNALINKVCAGNGIVWQRVSPPSSSWTMEIWYEDGTYRELEEIITLASSGTSQWRGGEWKLSYDPAESRPWILSDNHDFKYRDSGDAESTHLQFGLAVFRNAYLTKNT